MRDSKCGPLCSKQKDSNDGVVVVPLASVTDQPYDPNFFSPPALTPNDTESFDTSIHTSDSIQYSDSPR
jgi:hypothetical protein